MKNQETIETLNTMLKGGRYLGNGTHIPLEVLETFNKAIEALENQKTGHWIVYAELTGEWEGTKKYACDKCGEKVGVFKSNFCPNCGAKMEGE